MLGSRIARNAPVLLLLITITMAAFASANLEKRAGCNEGDRKCYGQDRSSPYYYRCTSGQWTLYTCGNGYVCGGNGGSGASCVSGNAPPPACRDGQRRCIGSSNPSLYYLCSGGTWKLYSCGNGYQCMQTSPLQATCNHAAPQCSNGQQRCIGDGRSGAFYSCMDGRWQSQSCSPGDRCINIPGGLVNCQVGGGRRITA